MYGIELHTAGRLFISARPPGGNDLAASIEEWAAGGIVSAIRLLEDAEIYELGLTQQRAHCDATGIRLTDFPIVDRGVPENALKAIALARSTAEELAAGRSVLIHCRAGIGRTGLLAACTIVACGIPADLAFERNPPRTRSSGAQHRRAASVGH
jgi:protein-tyrosine phosphatase